MLNWLKSMQMKKDKKRWMELQWLFSHLSLIKGSSWERVENPGRAPQTFVSSSPFTSPNSYQLQMQNNLRGRPIQTPVSPKIAILDLVMWNKGLQDTLPQDNEVWQGDNLSSSGNIQKMGWESMRKARNHKSQTQGSGRIPAPQANFKSQFFFFSFFKYHW